jgi:hypothetical protein
MADTQNIISPPMKQIQKIVSRVVFCKEGWSHIINAAIPNKARAMWNTVTNECFLVMACTNVIVSQAEKLRAAAER